MSDLLNEIFDICQKAELTASEFEMGVVHRGYLRLAAHVIAQQAGSTLPATQPLKHRIDEANRMLGSIQGPGHDELAEEIGIAAQILRMVESRSQQGGGNDAAVAEQVQAAIQGLDDAIDQALQVRSYQEKPKPSGFGALFALDLSRTLRKIAAKKADPKKKSWTI